VRHSVSTSAARAALVVLTLVAAGPAAAEPKAPRGFTSYGEPMFEDVFPDTEGVRRWVDQLGAVHERMDGLRVDFSKAVQQVLGEVARPRAARVLASKRCADLAAAFGRAQALGQRYLSQGRDLSRVYDLLTRLDEMGETIGLTPDYRVKVKRVREIYRSLRSDYREMKYAYYEQLIPELKHAGCDPDALLVTATKIGATASQAAASAPAAAPATTLPRAVPKKPPAEPPARTATMITYHVDNTSCPAPARVVIDGNPVGTVDAHTRRGFRTRSGPHQLCLLHEGSTQTCGQPGTLRKGYLHDGWTIQLKCPK
jgi:hypothetical protein